MPTLRPRKGADKVPAGTNASSTARASPDALSKRAPDSTGDGKLAAARSAMNNPTLPDEETQLISDGAFDERGGASSPQATPTSQGWAQRNQWIVLSLASGACAAFNGVFAKL
ncbi:hypothetical protein VTH82DRAFT_4564 [Thermothelomyces myriococcoides]